MLSNIFKREKIKEVYLQEKEFLIKIDIVEKKDILYIKRTKILKNDFKIKEKLKEHFDVFFNKKRKKDIFPIIKLTEHNVNENGLNYAVKIGETDENIRFCILTYHNCKIINEYNEEETTITFFLDQKVIEKEKIKFELPIGKYTYTELEGKKGLMVIL